MRSQPRQLELFELTPGRRPFEERFFGLKDAAVRHRIRLRLTKLELGNPGNWRSVGQGVLELKEDFGPGFRVYVGLDGETLVILLLVGDKSSQEKDIRLAQQYWGIYKARKGHG
jgi:putative addiction module killer protein